MYTQTLTNHTEDSQIYLSASGLDYFLPQGIELLAVDKMLLEGLKTVAKEISPGWKTTGKIITAIANIISYLNDGLDFPDAEKAEIRQEAFNLITQFSEEAELNPVKIERVKPKEVDFFITTEEVFVTVKENGIYYLESIPAYSLVLKWEETWFAPKILSKLKEVRASLRPEAPYTDKTFVYSELNSTLVELGE